MPVNPNYEIHTSYFVKTWIIARTFEADKKKPFAN